jgi:hypothetical protein
MISKQALPALWILVLLSQISHAGVWGQGYWGKMVWGDPSIYTSDLETIPGAPPGQFGVLETSSGYELQFNYDPSGGNDGWSVVQSFRLSCTPVGDSLAIVAQDSDAQIAIDLEEGGVYNCVAYAVNAIGDSLPSDVALIEIPLAASGLSPALIKAAIDAANRS